MQVPRVLVDRAVFRPLIHRSGLNARVVLGGTMAVGDRIEPCYPDQIDDELRVRNERVGLVVPPEVF